MTVSYKTTQDQDPQEPGSQHGLGVGPRDGMDQWSAPAGSLPRVVDPIHRKVVVKPPVTPPSGTRFFNQVSDGQNPSASDQKQAIEQLPTGALPTPSPLISNRAQTIEQLRATTLSATPWPSIAPNGPASNRQQMVEQMQTVALPGI